jgi:GTPase SAR1 family protein
MRHVECVFLGDHAIGQTSMLVTYTTNVFPFHFPFADIDNCVATLSIEKKSVTLHICDTRLHENKKIQRLPSRIHVFVLCFSLVSPASLESVQAKWAPGLKETCPATPYILVGLKSNLRDQFWDHPAEFKEQGISPIASSTGEAVKNAIGAELYFECSAQAQRNLKEVFEAAATIALHELVVPRPFKTASRRHCIVA